VVRRVLVRSYEGARKVAVAVVGTTVLLLGTSMIVLPGPAILVIPLGLGILAIEFAWARRWLRHVKEGSTAALRQLRGTRAA
jgi:tellurite resistance protein TerC